jgi:Domain of unknown function (DUF4303)
MPTLLDHLKSQVKNAIRAHVSKLPAGFGDAGFYGYALLTDTDVSSIGPVANSESDLKQKPGDTDYLYYRYCVDEWKHWKDFGLFDEVRETVDAIHRKSPNEFERNCETILSITLDSLADLEFEGLFGTRRLGRMIAVWQRDPGTIRLTSVQRLNSPDTVKEFISTKLG